MLFFHGNAGSLENRIYKLNDLSKLDLNYLIVAYRGFSGNKGSPSEQGLKDQSCKVLVKLKQYQRSKYYNLWRIFGYRCCNRSCKRSQLCRYYFESPFTSMLKLSRKYYPWAPTGLLLKDNMNQIRK